MILIFLTIGTLISFLISAENIYIKLIGIVLSILFSIVTVTVYITIRQRENLETPKNIRRYKHKGKALFVHGCALLLMGATALYSGIYLVAPLVLVAVFTLYEGWRIWQGYKPFIPIR